MGINLLKKFDIVRATPAAFAARRFSWSDVPILGEVQQDQKDNFLHVRLLRHRIEIRKYPAAWWEFYSRSPVTA